MHTVRKLFITLVTLGLLFLLIGVLLPAKRHLSRSIVIHAPIDIIFNEVNSLKQWTHWSPWQSIDPNVTSNYEGPEAGVGCTMSWASKHPKVGHGTQKIVLSKPNQHIVIDLNFVGWKGTTTASWYFDVQTADHTQVTWTHVSHNQGGLWGKYMYLVMFPQLGKSYAQGLQNLKEYVENLYTIQQEAQQTKVSDD